MPLSVCDEGLYISSVRQRPDRKFEGDDFVADIRIAMPEGSASETVNEEPEAEEPLDWEG